MHTDGNYNHAPVSHGKQTASDLARWDWAWRLAYIGLMIACVSLSVTCLKLRSSLATSWARENVLQQQLNECRDGH